MLDASKDGEAGFEGKYWLMSLESKYGETKEWPAKRQTETRDEAVQAILKHTATKERIIQKPYVSQGNLTD
jgi:hypothetical protein